MIKQELFNGEQFILQCKNKNKMKINEKLKYFDS